MKPMVTANLVLFLMTLFSAGLASADECPAALKKVNEVVPAYPRRAQSRGIEGYVMVKFTLNKSGEVVAPEVGNSKPQGIFDRAALDAMRSTLYEPVLKAGVPAVVSGCWERVEFALQAEKPGQEKERELERGRRDLAKVRTKTQACENGDRSACNALALWHYNGSSGLKADKRKAFELWKDLCNRGYAGSCGNLGVIYSKGEIVDKDLARAEKLLGKACSQGAGEDFCTTKVKVQREQRGPSITANFKYLDWMNWTFTHACSTAAPALNSASETIELRFFEFFEGKRTGEQWPDDHDEVYQLPGHSVFKNSKSVRLNCAATTTVCYGAGYESSGGRWGLGSDGKGSCANCCYPCRSMNSPTIELACE